MTSTLPSGERLSRGQLARFVAALTQALYDRTLEEERDILYYYDSNVMIDIILGADAPPAVPEVDLQTRLVWALLSAGYLGKARVLRPHALEVEGALQRHAAEGGGKNPYRKRLREFLQREGVITNIGQLDKARSGTRDEKVAKFVDLLLELGPETFIALERAADGAWQQRLVRLHSSILSFSEEEDRIQETLEDPLTWRFYSAVADARPKVHHPLNNLRDAVALCQLARRVRQGESDSRSHLVRFNTHSSTLSLIGNSELSNYLTYSTVLDVRGAQRWRAGLVFRTPYYYVLRASFEALSFPDLKRRTSQPAPVLSLAQLELLCERLNDALTENDTKMESLVEEIEVGGRRLAVVLGELERLGFVRSVLSDYEPPESLKKAVDGLGEVWKFIDTDEPQARMRDEIVDEAKAIGEALRFQVEGLREWLKTFRLIERAAVRIAGASEGAAIPDIYRDLGLVRWGEKLHESDEREVRAFCEAVVSGQTGDLISQCAALTWRSEHVGTVSGCMSVCCLLWTMSLFQRVVEVINRVQDTIKDKFPVSLNILRTAARLRSAGEFSEEEKWTHVLALEELVDREGTSDKGRLLIGLGYVAFYVWSRERRRLGDSGFAWAEKSFCYGKQAVELLADDPLGYAFAINHCAYVGAYAGVFPDETAKYFDSLRSCQGLEVWNYRFSDTLAYRELREGIRFWKESSEAAAELRKDLRQSAYDACKRAEALMLEAQWHFGDLEIPEHHREIRKLQGWLERAA